MKALMVIPSMLLSSVPDAFAKAGFQIQLAENATFALTMLERDQPDLIVSSDQFNDMSGRDLYEIIRSDPAMDKITFILLDGTPATKIPDSPKDLELSWMTSASEVVKAAKDLLAMSGSSLSPTPSPTVNTVLPNTLASPQSEAAPEGTASTKFPSKAINVVRTSDGTKSRQVGASGTLEIFTLFDLAVSLTSNLKDGKLYVRIADDEGMMFFFQGALTHAEYQLLVGEAALLKIFADADEYKNDTEFVFEPMDVNSLPKGFQTIDKSIDKLLFNVAVELDHQREAKAKSKETLVSSAQTAQKA